MIQSPQLFLLWYVAFLISLTVHEAAHAYVALKLGDKTAAKNGQVTLNPLPHIKRELVGTILVPLISFISSGWMLGWASAPYNLNWAKRYPKKFAFMSIAGPFANLLIVILVILIINIGYRFGLFNAPEAVNLSSVTSSNYGGLLSNIADFLSILFSLNIMLFTFNLLPLPILDGSKIPMFFIKPNNAEKFLEIMNDGKLLIVTLIITYYFFDYIHEPIRLFFINLLYPGITYG